MCRAFALVVIAMNQVSTHIEQLKSSFLYDVRPAQWFKPARVSEVMNSLSGRSIRLFGEQGLTHLSTPRALRWRGRTPRTRARYCTRSAWSRAARAWQSWARV
ncbi:hypothetical protein PR001_g13999 [Phytophthora rubi]|uniref:Uncharacterized protein n=1 Tax=Phytophthora rubi TaxID=129364 RepID=A0A6A3LL85_9STRA|nr:hypothetical protein PR001_g13999 [Phytophthora rubi]